MLAQSSESGNPQDVPAQEIHQLQPCENCHAPVYWLREKYHGRWAKIDMGHTAGGDVLVNLTRGTYERLTPDERRIYGGWLHALHSQICRNVDQRQQGMW